MTAEDAHGPGATHGGDYSAVERRRIEDLLRGNTALLLEHRETVHRGYIPCRLNTSGTGCSGSSGAARRKARAKQRTDLPAGDRRSPPTGSSTAAPSGRRRCWQPNWLAAATRSPSPARSRSGPLIERPRSACAWCANPGGQLVVDLPAGPAVVISGDTNTENGFATLWRAAGAGRRWLVARTLSGHADLLAATGRRDEPLRRFHRRWGNDIGTCSAGTPSADETAFRDPTASSCRGPPGRGPARPAIRCSWSCSRGSSSSRTPNC